VYEVKSNGIARTARFALGGDRFLADRFADHTEPLHPLAGTARLVIGERQKPATCPAATGLCPQERQA
jgi:hypothetical protein